jgi:asparagine synthase (glutamine-hydrolysing)
MGFGVPIEEWINRELRQRIHETLTSRSALQRGYFEPRYIRVLLDEHERGRRDHSASLWALFVLELWQRTFVDKAANASHQSESIVANIPAGALQAERDHNHLVKV